MLVPHSDHSRDQGFRPIKTLPLATSWVTHGDGLEMTKTVKWRAGSRWPGAKGGQEVVTGGLGVRATVRMLQRAHRPCG